MRSRTWQFVLYEVVQAECQNTRSDFTLGVCAAVEIDWYRTYTYLKQERKRESLIDDYRSENNFRLLSWVREYTGENLPIIARKQAYN